jgi:transcriptional regulator with XRE-family HTH domain
VFSIRKKKKVSPMVARMNYFAEGKREKNMREIGTRMGHVRNVTGLRQKVVADRLGVSFSHYSKVEVGLNKASDKMLQNFCDEFGVSFDWLISGDGQPFCEVREETAPYGNALLAAKGRKGGGVDIDDVLPRCADTVAKMLSEVPLDQIQRSAKDLHISMGKLLRGMVLDRLKDEFAGG